MVATNNIVTVTVTTTGGSMNTHEYRFSGNFEERVQEMRELLYPMAKALEKEKTRTMYLRNPFIIYRVDHVVSVSFSESELLEEVTKDPIGFIKR